MVLFRVLTLPQAYRGIDWNACILIGGMIPLATAMSGTGSAQLIADTLISLVGEAGPRALAAGLFLCAFALTQLISNTASTLVMLPIALATGPEVGSRRCR
jgi:di/tricarboxylate transporter